MRRLRSLTAWLLVALWLPVTLHCSLEQAGLLGDAEACVNDCAEDNCATLENGMFKSTTAAVKVSAPFLLVCLCRLLEIAPPTLVVPAVSPERSDSPPELARTWQFAVRAAPLPGAPSLIS